MRTRAVAATFVVLFLLSRASAFGNGCEKYICEQTVTEYGASDRYCAETTNGQWVTCTVRRDCIMVVGSDGRMTKQCTAADCEGEMCMWV